MALMQSLEIENFKSFKGKHVIGPLKRFTAIIGPNGSGKSNLMDAISFVLGERGANLRVRKMGDLIHGASVGKPVNGKARVLMNFIDSNNRNRTFCREIVSTTSSEYRVDGAVVTPITYRQSLQAINIFIKAHNFLVYQGSVESISMRTPKELTAMFEELSRSSELKPEYERLKSDMLKAEAEVQENMSKRRDVATEKKEARVEKDQANNYQMAKDEFLAKTRDYYLAEIFRVEKLREAAKEQLEGFQQELEAAKIHKEECDEELGEKNRSVRERYREMTSLEKNVGKEQKRVEEQNLVCSQLNQEVEHVETKIEATRKTQRISARKADQHATNVTEVQQKLDSAKNEKVTLERQMVQESQQQQLNLDADQMAEYRQLKNDAERQTASTTTKLNNLQQEQQTDRGIIEHEQRRLAQCNAKIEEKAAEIEREKQNVAAMRQSEAQTNQQIVDGNAEVKKMEKQLVLDEKESVKLNKELNEVMKKLNEMQGDVSETRREQRRREALENLKRIFTDEVHGRLIDLCSPSNSKYKVAITKILRKHMNSIVCDTDDTARKCIAYLKEQRFYPETFLPLNSLDVKPINESLRSIDDQPETKLVYDVIQCNIAETRKAVQFVCKDSLVTETSDQARKIAYGTDRHRAVALDGTLFQPSGVISGGGKDLKTHAKKWDEKDIRTLKEQKRTLTEKLAALQPRSKRETDIELKRRKIQSMEARLRLTGVEMNKKLESIEQMEAELNQLRSEPAGIQARIESKQQAIAERENEIQKLNVERNKVEDELFAAFCRKIKVNHIREYEERELHFHENMQNKLLEYDTKIQRLENELEYLRSEDCQTSVDRENNLLRSLEQKLKEVKNALKAENDKLKNLENALGELQTKLNEAKTAVEKAESELNSSRKQARASDKELHSLEKKILQQEQIIRRKSNIRHNFLHECKIKNVALTLLSGSLERLLVIDDSFVDDSTQASSNQSQQRSQSASQSIYSAEGIEVDFAPLTAKNKRLLAKEKKADEAISTLKNAAAEAEATFARLQAPAQDANERMEEVKEREKEISDRSDATSKRCQKARDAFEKVKNERLVRFQSLFEPVSQQIDEIYKKLSQNTSAQAFLGPVNQEEPFLDGINYNCIAPGKRFRPMDSLSGGEKTISALALLFAIHSSNPAPFFVLDEIDAALDNTNIGKVVQYIMDRSRNDVQIVVISLKEELFNKADSLVGVYPGSLDPCMSSEILSLDLSHLAI